jgi:DNA-binding Lrp family transcriptional regulator
MNEDLEIIYQFILEKLRISPDVKIEWSYPISIGERELLIDLAIESRDTVTLVDIKSRINEDTIYRIYTFSHLIDKQVVGKKEIRLVCAGKSLKYSTQELATRLGVEILLIPPKLYQYLSPRVTASEVNASFEHLKASPSRLTSEKAWKIVCSLLTDKQSNILSVSKKTGVSYGWTNSIIHKLEDSGFITVDYGLRIKDMDKLFNIVSWERALDGLLLETINTNFSTATRCIDEVALNLNKLGIDYAFTAHSSAIAYGSSIMREDTAYIYLPNPSDREVIRSFSERETGGCRLKVYVPERDIMKSSTMFNGVRIVDVCQNILDLAGLGMDGRIAAKDLVNKIGK